MMNLYRKLDAWFDDKKRNHDITHSLFFLSVMAVSLAFGASWSGAFTWALSYVVFKELIVDPITVAIDFHAGWYKFRMDNVFDVVTYLQLGLPIFLVSQGEHVGALLSFVGLLGLWKGFEKYRSDQ